MVAAGESGWSRMSSPRCCLSFFALTLAVSPLFAVSIKKEIGDNMEKYDHYYSHEALTERLQSFTRAYPELCQLFSIGMSVESRELWVMRITADLQAAPPDRPQFKYVGNMHGDETVSRQVLIYLIQYLLEAYGKDPRITRLINTTDIYILPSLNPDGFFRAQEGDCRGQNGGRENARHLDLNRNFPDQFYPQVVPPDPAQLPEVLAMMKWIRENRFVLSGNLHGGSVVASYPFDDSSTHQETGYYSRSTDDKVFQHLARAYASNHPIMKTGHPQCKDEEGEVFPDGITNGAHWYDVQDLYCACARPMVLLGHPRSSRPSDGSEQR